MLYVFFCFSDLGPHCSKGNSVQTSESDLVAGLLKLLGISVPFDIPIGIGCSPISFLGKLNTWCVFRSLGLSNTD